MTIEELLKNAIISTGSKRFWAKELITQVLENARIKNKEEKLQRMLEYLMVQGEEFKFSRLHLLVFEEREYKRIENQNGELVDIELAKGIFDYFEQAKSVNEFYEWLMPLYQLLRKKGLWQKEGRWNDWIEKNGKE